MSGLTDIPTQQLIPMILKEVQELKDYYDKRMYETELYPYGWKIRKIAGQIYYSRDKREQLFYPDIRAALKEQKEIDEPKTDT